MSGVLIRCSSELIVHGTAGGSVHGQTRQSISDAAVPKYDKVFLDRESIGGLGNGRRLQ
jgi:hypothetical protein